MPAVRNWKATRGMARRRSRAEAMAQARPASRLIASGGTSAASTGLAWRKTRVTPVR
uniref:Uncharacterized protein n=1 Tax=Arundo donax TaxID=35708 RepID=A0A0A9H1V9_ARUDO